MLFVDDQMTCLIVVVAAAVVIVVMFITFYMLLKSVQIRHVNEQNIVVLKVLLSIAL